MKDRELACIHYKCEGKCDLGHDGTFRKACQHCKQYKPVKGGQPARRNLKKEKMRKLANDRRNWV